VLLGVGSNQEIAEEFAEFVLAQLEQIPIRLTNDVVGKSFNTEIVTVCKGRQVR
jgi:hypothetical protein